MIEVEQKYRVADMESLVGRLAELGAQPGATEQHRDIYFNHPCRDFAETGEAFRVRHLEGVPLITYKAAKLAGSIKARRELEWRLDPGDPDGAKTTELLQLLGFRQVAVVTKMRRPYSLDTPVPGIQVLIDSVESLGDFAEVEWVVDTESAVEQARESIGQLSNQLGLRAAEPRSYLEMVLESNSGKE